MQTVIQNWLVADLPIFGLRGQNWMAFVVLGATLYVSAAFAWRRAQTPRHRLSARLRR